MESLNLPIECQRSPLNFSSKRIFFTCPNTWHGRMPLMSWKYITCCLLPTSWLTLGIIPVAEVRIIIVSWQLSSLRVICRFALETAMNCNRKQIALNMTGHYVYSLSLSILYEYQSHIASASESQFYRVSVSISISAIVSVSVSATVVAVIVVVTMMMMMMMMMMMLLLMMIGITTITSSSTIVTYQIFIRMVVSTARHEVLDPSTHGVSKLMTLAMSFSLKPIAIRCHGH